MALFPCSFDGARYAGPQRTIYISAFGPLANYRRRARACREHFEDALSWAQLSWIDLSEDDDLGNTCSSCNGRRVLTITVTFYEQHQEPQVFYRDACTGCADALQAEPLACVGKPLPATTEPTLPD